MKKKEAGFLHYAEAFEQFGKLHQGAFRNYIRQKLKNQAVNSKTMAKVCFGLAKVCHLLEKNRLKKLESNATNKKKVFLR